MKSKDVQKSNKNKPPDLCHPWSRRYVLPSQKWRGVPLQTEARFSENLNFSREFILNHIVSFPRKKALSHCACPKIFLYVGLLNFLNVGLLNLSLLHALLNLKPLQQLNHVSFPCKQTSCVFQPTSHIFIQLHMLSDMCSTNHNETSPQWFSIWSSYFPQGNMIFCISINGICLWQERSLRRWVQIASFLHSSPHQQRHHDSAGNLLWRQKPTYRNWHGTRKYIECERKLFIRAFFMCGYVKCWEQAYLFKL